VSSPDRTGTGHPPVITATVLAGAGIAALALWVPQSRLAVALILAGAGVALGIRQVVDRRRLDELRRLARAYAEGDLERRAAIGGFDAIARLGAQLNGLGESLAAARAAVEAQRRMLDEALGTLAEGVACIDDLDHVLYANAAWRHLVAGGSAVAPGSLFYEHMPAAALSATIGSVRASGQADAVEFEHRRRRLRATVSRTGPDRLVIVLHDLTELKRLEGARREFVAAVSHELKTPLTAVAGFAETLLDGALDQPETARGFVEKISRHAERLTVLVRDVLTLSRLEQGAWEVHPAPLDLVALAHGLVEEHQPAAAERQVRLAVEAPERLDMVGDRELLHQLLGNLVSNAIRYNRPSGSVTIRLEARGERIAAAIADTGIGIPAEHRERVFERFYRVDAHRSRASGGTGLGLAIVKQLTEALGGAIALDSSPAGSTFTVDLPLADPRARAA
jgi:two-component system phosphate regulon sensor histidine kinase PhoR